MEIATRKRIFRDLPATFVLPAIRRSSGTRSVENWFLASFTERSGDSCEDHQAYRSVLRLPFFDQTGNSLTIDELAPSLLLLKKMAAQYPSRLFALIDPYAGTEESLRLPLGSALQPLGKNIVHSGVLRDNLYSNLYPASIAIFGDITESNAGRLCDILEKRKSSLAMRRIEICVTASNQGLHIAEDIALALGMDLRVFHINYGVPRKYANWCRDVNLAWFCGEYIAVEGTPGLTSFPEVSPLLKLLKLVERS